MSTPTPEGQLPLAGPGTAAPDMPEIPVARMSRFTKVLLGFCTLVVGGYTAAAATGWEPGTPTRDEVPSSVRSSPGGYRSFHFWHSGYHGGK